MRRCIVSVVIVIMVCVGCTSHDADFAHCAVSKNTVEIYRGKTASYRFDLAGVSVNKQDSHYALNWADIRELDVGKTVWFGKYKESIKKVEMTLSIASRRRDTPLTEDIGLLDASCWSSLFGLLDRNKVPTTVQMQISTVDDPKYP